MQAILKAGTAQADITPPPGSIMACFPRRRTPHDPGNPSIPGKPDRIPRCPGRAHDRLKARALVLASESEIVALCVCDVPHFDRVDVDRIRAMTTKRVRELSGCRVILAGTHTHSGADTLYLFGNEPSDPVIHEMDAAIAAAIEEAYNDLEEVTPYVGRTDLHLTHNRRVRDEDGKARMAMEYEEGITTGPVDPELFVLRLDSARGAKAILFNYTAHALTLGPANTEFSADYPGEACRHIEEAFPGALAIFTNGAAGNVHPRQCMRGDFEVMEKTGKDLAEGVMRTAGKARCLPQLNLVHESRILTFPHVRDPCIQVKPEIHAVRIGRFAVGFVPGEFFVEFQLAFKKRLRPDPAVLVGYCGGWTGYVPTCADYEAGGYGVTEDTADPLERSRTSLPPGAGEQIIDELVGLAQGTGTEWGQDRPIQCTGMSFTGH
ncbi:MAG: neutral/alkaline non-lysosomal ceramidase N-terminal domain-containing protein [Candidatus Pacebacteria bacterium]|nr:neutral/alkaline non-lysosomal ceramidase N-terminal domain-containing protein [Candidatus Paceibacterota bacterium]